MTRDELDAHRRMRACLEGIVDLDPPGVTLRMAELDALIAEGEGGAPTGSRAAHAAPRPDARRIEIVPIGAGSLRAA